MKIELVLDTNVVSYLFKGGSLGAGYLNLISNRAPGMTLLSLAELRSGVVRGSWSDEKIAALDAFIGRFMLVRGTPEIANLCGALIAQRMRVGRAITWPDAWAAAASLWLDVPLVTHDRDLEAIPTLRVLTLHQNWRVRDEPVVGHMPSIPLTPVQVAEAEAAFAIELPALVARLRAQAAAREMSGPVMSPAFNAVPACEPPVAPVQ